MEDASSSISDQLGTITIEDEDSMEEEQVQEVKEEQMSDTESVTYSEKTTNLINLKDTSNSNMPDSQAINYLNESPQGQDLLTGDESAI